MHKNTAKGYVINRDLTLTPCFILKDGEGNFAHGESLRDALEALEDKRWQGIEESERINKFIERFDPDKTYKGRLFFEWHNKLTGSCRLGREKFVKDNGIDLEGEFSVMFFLNLVKGSYGGDTVKKLISIYEEKY